MTTSQLRAIKYFIARAETFFRFSDTTNGIQYVNGPVIWSLEKTDDGRFWLRANNNTDEREWYNSFIHLNALVGKRGGIKIYTCEGIKKEYLKV